MVDTIIKSFDIWTDAQGLKSKGRVRSIDNISLEGISRLRELILELAIRGKLAQQNSNDEPTKELIKRIEKEKVQIIKRKNTQSDITHDNNAIQLPPNWEWAKLGTICEIKGGKRLPSGHSFSVTKTPYVYIQVTNMKLGTILENDLKYISTETRLAISRYTINKNDLYITIAGTIGDVGIVPDSFDDMNLTENAAKIVFKFVDKDWLQKALSSKLMQKQFIEKTKQLAQPKLALHRIENSVLPIPPVEEQKRIVSKVEQLMALCDQLEAQQTNNLKTHQQLVKSLLETLTLAKDADEVQIAWQQLLPHFGTLFCTEDSIEQLKQTILQLAIMGRLVKQNPTDEPAKELMKRIEKEKEKLVKEGKIKKENKLQNIADIDKSFSVPNSWEWVRLVQISADVHYGYTASANYDSNEIRLLRITDIQNDKVEWETVPGCEIAENQASKYLLGNGDILIARTGGTIGKSYLVENLTTKSVFASYLIRIKRLPISNSQYLKIYLKSSLYWNQLYESSMGTGQPNVNGNALKSLKVPLPPIEEQIRIVAKVDEFIGICDQLIKKIIKIQEIQNTLSKTIVENAVA